MADYDDDDIIDYENDGQMGDEFNEDNLNDEDYNLLYDLLPELKAKTDKYEIDEFKLKEILWLNYFEIDAAVEEITKDFKPTLLTPKLSKLEQLAQKRKLPEGIQSPITSESKLSGLLASRKSGTHFLNPDSKLVGLLKKRSEQPQGLSGLLNKTSLTGERAGLAGLSKVGSSGESRKGLAGLIGKTNSDPNLSKVSVVDKLKSMHENRFQKTGRLRRPKVSKPVLADLEHVSDDHVMEDAKPASASDEIPFEFEFTFQFQPNRMFTDRSENIITNSFFNGLTTNKETELTEKDKRRDLGSTYDKIFNIFTNNSQIAKKTTTNFQKPSPDQHRKDVNSLSQTITKVKLTEDVEPIKAKTPKPIAPKKKKSKTGSNINVASELAKRKAKPNLSFVVIGHVDSGKSTLVGRLLYDLKIVDSKLLHKLTKESESVGKASFSLAWIMDQTQEERNRGVTVDICQTQFETDTSSFTIIDSPGHQDYVPQMINGVTQADVAIVVIDASSFETGFSATGQNREHLTIAKNLGIDRCIVVVNKMDLIEWSHDRYQMICDTLKDYLVEELDYQKEDLQFIPTSGYLGGNIVKLVSKEECVWFEGESLLEWLELQNRKKEHTFDKNSQFILTINEVQETNKNDELIVSGRVNSGMVKLGDSIVISPSNEVSNVDSITITRSNVGSSLEKNESQQLAIEGEFITLKLKGLDNLNDIKVGDLISTEGKEIKAVHKFKCDLKVFNLDRPLLIGTEFILFRNNISIPARLSSIESIENTKTGKVSKKKHLASNNKASVIIEIMERDVPMLKFDTNPKLGRLVIRRFGITIGAGKITELC